MGAPDLMRLLIKNWTKHGIVPTATLQTLSIGAADAESGWYVKSYANSNISIFIIQKAQQFKVLKEGLFVDYDAVGFTKSTLHEGDLVTDQAQNTYLVLAVRDKNILSQFMYNEVDLKKTGQAALIGNWLKWTAAFHKFKRAIEKNAAATSNVTLYPMTVDEQDSTTGWYICHYQTHSSIDCVILNARAATKWMPPGKHTYYAYFGYTLDDVNAGDILADEATRKYRIRSIMPVSLGSKLVFFELGLERLDEWTIAHLFAIQLDVRVFHMGRYAVSYYIQGATVDIYLGGVLILSGTTDAFGTYKTTLLPGTYDIIIHKTGYQQVTKHETLTIQTELMVNLPLAGPEVIGPPIPIPLGSEINYQECIVGATGKAETETISKTESFSIQTGPAETDVITKSESVVITNI